MLFFIAYQLWWLPRVMFTGPELDRLPAEVPKWPFPSLYVVDAVLFGAFSVMSVFFALGLFSYRGSFRAADVDVLFATPLSPRTVLVARVLRDIWLSLLVPLIGAILLWRPAKFGWAVLFSGIPNPETANTAFRVAAVSYLLLAVAWVWVGYAVSLSFAKPDVRTDRMRTILSWTVFATLLVLGYSSYLRVVHGPLPESLVHTGHALDLRTAFFLATGATELTMSALTGSLGQALLGGGLLLGAIAAGFIVASANTAWMYEQAALRAAVTETSLKLRKSGDMFAIAAERARTRRGKLWAPRWFGRWSVRGPRALLWKEGLVTVRTSLWTTATFALLGIGMSVVASLFPSRRGTEVAGVFLLFMQAMFLLGPTVGQAQAGFIESLRRIDLLKPLPFTSQAVVFHEVLGKAVGPLLASYIGLFAALFLKPAFWPYVLGGLVMFPPLTLALSAVCLLLVVLLPDVEDPTQRGFRGLATLLGMVACTGPPLALFAGLMWLKVPVLLASLPTSALTAGICWLATKVAGQVYDDFNPSL